MHPRAPACTRVHPRAPACTRVHPPSFAHSHSTEERPFRAQWRRTQEATASWPHSRSGSGRSNSRLQLHHIASCCITLPPACLFRIASTGGPGAFPVATCCSAPDAFRASSLESCCSCAWVLEVVAVIRLAALVEALAAVDLLLARPELMHFFAPSAAATAAGETRKQKSACKGSGQPCSQLEKPASQSYPPWPAP